MDAKGIAQTSELSEDLILRFEKRAYEIIRWETILGASKEGEFDGDRMQKRVSFYIVSILKCYKAARPYIESMEVGTRYVLRDYSAFTVAAYREMTDICVVEIDRDKIALRRITSGEHQ